MGLKYEVTVLFDITDISIDSYKDRNRNPVTCILK